MHPGIFASKNLNLIVITKNGEQLCQKEVEWAENESAQWLIK